MNKQQKRLYQRIEKQEDILNILDTESSLKDLSVVIGYYIKEHGITDEIVMNHVSSFFKNELTTLLFRNPKIEDEFKTLISCIKNRISKLDKTIEEEQNERLLLKSCYKDINDIIDVYDTTTTKSSSYYNILEYFMSREDCLLYVKETLKSIPDIANIKHDDKHIIIIILEKYIENFKILLKDKNSTYINPYYLYEIFTSFIESRYIRVTSETKNTMYDMLNDFKNYVKNTLIKEKRKNAALDEIKKVYNEINNCVNYTKVVNYSKYEVNEDYLARLHTRVMEDIEEKYQYNDIETIDAYTLNNNYYAISTKSENDETTISFHVPNISPFVKQDSDVTLYFYNDLITKSNKELMRTTPPDPMYDVYMKKYHLLKGHKYPCITYNLTYSKNGVFKDFNITTSDIRIKEKYEACEDYYFLVNKAIDKDAMYYELLSLFRVIVAKNNLSILDNSVNLLNEYFEYSLSQLFAQYMNSKKLPCILYGKLKSTPDLGKEHLFNLNNTLYKLNKEEYSNMLNILNRNPDKYHYSIIYNENNEYNLDLLKPCSYLSLQLERTINLLVFNSRHLDGEKYSNLKKYYTEFLYELSNDLNSMLSYTNEDYLKMNKGRIKVKKLPNDYQTRRF